MKKRRFDALLIDFYGTISAGDREAVERACRRVVLDFGLPYSAAEFAVQWGERFFDLIDRSNHAEFRTLYECEQSSLQDTLRPLVGEIDPVPYVAEIEAYWASPPIHPDAMTLLESVEVPVCCVSNADTEALLAAIAGNGLRFTHVVSSQSVRCYKPEPEIFRQAIKRVGVGADRVLHVGDSKHSDVGGASKVGITTAWLCRDDRIHDIGTCDPHHMIRSLTEVLNLLS